MVFSILSLQCTVQELEIRTEDIQGGLRCNSTKRTMCVIHHSGGLSWGGGELEEGGGRHTCGITLSAQKTTAVVRAAFAGDADLRLCQEIKVSTDMESKKNKQKKKQRQGTEKENTTKHDLKSIRSSLSLSLSAAHTLVPKN